MRSGCYPTGCILVSLGTGSSHSWNISSKCRLRNSARAVFAVVVALMTLDFVHQAIRYAAIAPVLACAHLSEHEQQIISSSSGFRALWFAAFLRYIWYQEHGRCRSVTDRLLMGRLGLEPEDWFHTMVLELGIASFPAASSISTSNLCRPLHFSGLSSHFFNPGAASNSGSWAVKSSSGCYWREARRARVKSPNLHKRHPASSRKSIQPRPQLTCLGWSQPVCNFPSAYRILATVDFGLIN